MKFRTPHRWDLSPRRAAALQSVLRERLDLKGGPRAVRLVAGADISFDRGGTTLYAAIVVLEMDRMTRVATVCATGPARFPYVPGLLSFREAPLLLRAFRRLAVIPDLLVCDGQGIAHPRGFGLASHLGLILGLPSIGCAKSRLIGEYRAPGPRRGAQAPLMEGGRRVGTVLRTRDGVAPIFVSPGNRISHREAVRWALACCRGRRLPEPTRQAHMEVNRLRLSLRESGAR